MPAFLVMQQREYQKHQIEVFDRGKAGCAVVVHPPPSMGETWEVPREGAVVTLTDRPNYAKAWVDAVMGRRLPHQHFRHAARRDR